MTLRGTPTLYYGEEIGMTDVEIAAELQRDPARLDGADRGRDPQRTPIRWDGTASGAFTTGSPWLPMGTDVASVNVAIQRDDPRSMLSLHRTLINLRRDEPALRGGDWALIGAEGGLLAYERTGEGSRMVVVLNFGPTEVSFESPTIKRGKLLLSTRLDRVGGDVRGTVRLGGDEGVLINASPGEFARIER